MPHVKVTTRLPFRIRVTDETEFKVPLGDGMLTHVTIREYQVPKAEGEERGSGIDEGRGTFLQSTGSVLFPVQALIIMVVNDAGQFLRGFCGSVAWRNQRDSLALNWEIPTRNGRIWGPLS